VSPDRSEARERELLSVVDRMSSAMCYEPWYRSQVISCPALGAYVGHVGRSCRESGVSPTPVGLIVVTTGDAGCESDNEIFTRSAAVGLRAGSSSSGHASDAAADSLSRLTTLAAGFVIDERRATCLLFNDRYGVERIFLHTVGPRTLFSSEAKAILAVAPSTRAFDATGLAEWLACGCTLGTRSLFRDIEVLDAGTVLKFSLGKVGRRRYFDRAVVEELEPVSGDQFLEEFPVTLRSAVNRFVRCQPAVGVSLTGGIDSRMVMASLDMPQGSVPCYTFGSMYRTTVDASIAREVAKACGQPHDILKLGREFLANVPQELERAIYISDGYLGCSGAAELYLNRRARCIAPARLTGNWGGELMRGVRAFKHILPNGGFVQPSLDQRMRDSAREFGTAAEWNPLSFALFRQMPLQGYGRYAIERSQVVTGTPFLSSDVVNWLYRAPAAVRGSTECYRKVIAHRPELLQIPTDGGRLGTGSGVLRMLRLAHRRGIAKAEYVTSHGAPNWMATLCASAPSGLLETRFLGCDKFQHFRVWFRRDLAVFLRETLRAHSSSELSAWFDLRRVSAMVDDHIAGRANYTDELDKVLTLKLAASRLFSSAAGNP